MEAATIANDILPNDEIDTYGSDTLAVNTSLSLGKFPFGVRKGQKGDLALQNWLGLGRNSTFLNALVSKGAILSRTYAFWAGRFGTETLYQTDGSLVFGGYDAAKMSGNNITLPFTDEDGCAQGNIVTITDMRLSTDNGSTSSILGSVSPLKACVVPSHAVLDFPDDIWNAFVAVSGLKVYSNTTAGVSFGYGWLGRLVDRVESWVTYYQTSFPSCLNGRTASSITWQFLFLLALTLLYPAINSCFRILVMMVTVK